MTVAEVPRRLVPVVTRAALVIACLAALATALLMWATFPLNVGAYDYPNYVRMIADGSSNLIHASGYPAILHGLTHAVGAVPTDAMDPAWLAEVQSIQNLLHLCLFGLAVWLALRLFGRVAAAATALLWGTNILFLSTVNAAAPEWLQGDLMILALLLAASTWQVRGARQAWLLVLAGGACGVAYLVKYNALFIGIGFAGLVFGGAATWMRGTARLGVTLAVGAACVTGYAATYHAATTGTARLSFDHTWVFTTALPPGYFTSDPETLGIWSLRFAALAALTPPTYGVAHAFPTVDWGAPAAVRAEYAPTYDRVMRMSRGELVALVRRTPLPAEMTNFTSSIPLYYHYGLPRTDAFGLPIFLEAVWRDPWMMARRLWSRLLLHTLSPAHHQAVPTRDRPLGVTFGSRDPSGFVALTLPEGLFSPQFAPYYNPSLTVWGRGLDLVSVVLSLRSSRELYVLLNLMVVVAVLLMPPGPARAQLRWLAFALLAIVLGSAALIGIRTKEMVALTPLLCVVWGAALAALPSIASRLRGVSLTSTMRRESPGHRERPEPASRAADLPESIGPVEQ